MRNRIKLAMNSGSSNVLKGTIRDGRINQKDGNPLFRLTKVLIRGCYHIRCWRNQRSVVKDSNSISSKRHTERITISLLLFSMFILIGVIFTYVSFFTFHFERQYHQSGKIATIKSSTASGRIAENNQKNNNNNNYDANSKSDKNNPLVTTFLDNQKIDNPNPEIDVVHIMKATKPNVENIARRTEEGDINSDGGSSNDSTLSAKVTNSTSATAASYRIISHAKVVTLKTLRLSPEEQPLLTRSDIGKNTTVEDALTNESHDTEEIVWVAGIVLDPSNITKNVFHSIVQLNCNTSLGKNLNIHILTSSSASSSSIEATYQQYYTYQRQFNNTNESCGKFILATEPSPSINVTTTSTVRQKKNGRIDAIAAARDYQRKELRNHFNTTNNSSTSMRNNFVIVIDLDLISIPNLHEIMKQINEMTRIPNNTTYGIGDNDKKPDSSYYDIICAAGIMYQPYGYYDTFATVLLPNTFVFPVLGRLSKSLNPGEDTTMIRSEDIYGTVTQYDILDYFENSSRSNNKTAPLIPGNLDPLQYAKGEEEDAYYNQFVRPVPVRSCFGGFAIYRAHTYFNPWCDYSTPYQQQQYHPNEEGEKTMTLNENEEEEEKQRILMMKRYSSRRSKRPCEHVMFHDCLLRTSAKHQQLTSVAVHPRLRTEWNERTNIFGNVLWEGATRHDGLNTYFNQRTRGERLVSPNQRYTLRINEVGILVVEDWRTATEKNTSTFGTTLWTPPIESSHNIFRTVRWTHMFLWLGTDGKLQLIKHVPHHSIIVMNNFTDSKHCEYSSSTSRIATKLTLENPCQCNVKLDSCTILVWSKNFSLLKGERERLSLTLSDDGVLSIISHPSEKKRIVWKAPKNAKSTII